MIFQCFPESRDSTPIRSRPLPFKSFRNQSLVIIIFEAIWSEIHVLSDCRKENNLECAKLHIHDNHTHSRAGAWTTRITLFSFTYQVWLSSGMFSTWISVGVIRISGEQWAIFNVWKSGNPDCTILFNTLRLCTLSTECVCVFRMVLTINDDCLRKQH
jgi:hypothetical protein